MLGRPPEAVGPAYLVEQPRSGAFSGENGCVTVQRGAATPDHWPAPQERRPCAFDALVSDVSHCRRCPRMEGRTRVLGHANGPLTARVLLVAEAPGRFGADALGIPLSGDRTGHTFEHLLATAGLQRSDLFISNAVLCNPRDHQGHNACPTRDEIANCSGHLRRLITLLDPDWVVTLGGVALHAIATVEPHTVVLQREVGQSIPWFGRMLVPLYHPGPRALIRRPLPLQEQDYLRLATLISSRTAQIRQIHPD
jgi:uracil-DNA glycosylase family 4